MICEWHSRSKLTSGRCSSHSVELSVCPTTRPRVSLIPAVFRKQHTLTIEQQRDIGRHFGPLHRHPTYAVPRRGDLDDVVGESC